MTNIFYDIENNCYRTYPDGDKASGNEIRNVIEHTATDYYKLLKDKELLIELNQNLLKENKRYKEVINKAIEYVSNKKAIINTDVIRIFDLFKIDEQGYIDELLDILKEVK